jgi:hypothetical protein
VIQQIKIKSSLFTNKNIIVALGICTTRLSSMSGSMDLPKLNSIHFNQVTENEKMVLFKDGLNQQVQN